MIDLSILICSVHTRYKTFGPKIQDQVWSQYALLSAEDQERVEIILLTDNKKRMLGEKRNNLVDLAQGKYVQFIDDDDRISPDMFKALLDAIDVSDADVITHLAEVSLNGSKPKICRYSMHYENDHNTSGEYHRLPNHICCVKRDLARQVRFPNVVYGEDAGYSKALKSHLQTEHAINKVLYYYDYNQNTSEPQDFIQNNTQPPVADVIILSCAATPQLYSMTQTAINDILQKDSVPVNIIVVEGTERVYKNATTVYSPGKFNYNRAANLGASYGSAEWLVIANNDLSFEQNWLSELLAADYPVVSPLNPGDKRQEDVTENEKGWITGTHFCGWCFAMKRSVYDQIDGFDELVDFWCSDDVVVEQLKLIDLPPMIVYNSRVKHIRSQTLNIHPDKDDLMYRNLWIFNQKYNQHKLESHPFYQRWVRMNT